MIRREGRERERVDLVSFSGTRLRHLTPATEWARIPCPLGRKLRPANRNSKEECMQIATAKGNWCPQCLCGGQTKMAPASLTDTHLEDNSSIKSLQEFPSGRYSLWNNCCLWFFHEWLSLNSNNSPKNTNTGLLQLYSWAHYMHEVM